MISSRCSLGIVLLLAYLAPAVGQDQTKTDLNSVTGPCWEIANPAQDMTPQNLVLLNRCSGQTWIMEKIFFVDKQGRQTGEFTYRWAPISMESQEAKMSTHQLLAQPPH
jgi:hypothetical protein